MGSSFIDPIGQMQFSLSQSPIQMVLVSVIQLHFRNRMIRRFTGPLHASLFSFRNTSRNVGGFLKWEKKRNMDNYGWFILENPMKPWMIWGYPYALGNLHLWFQSIETCSRSLGRRRRRWGGALVKPVGRPLSCSVVFGTRPFLEVFHCPSWCVLVSFLFLTCPY